MLDAGLTDGGMIDAGMPAPQISRWQAVRQALVDPVDGVVPRLQGLVRFGLAVYGTAPTCPLPLGTIEPSLDNFAPIQSGLPFLPPGVTTPTGLALDQVVDLLPDPKNNLDATVGPQIIILATDGDPNSCDPPPFLAAVPPTNYAPSIQAALKAQQKNLRMYVVSVGQDAAAQHLQEMANLGAGLGQFDSPGAEVFYPEDPAALAATLETLIGDELSCEVSLEGKGVKQGSECMGTVTLNGNELECNGADGWVLTDAAGRLVRVVQERVRRPASRQLPVRSARGVGEGRAGARAGPGHIGYTDGRWGSTRSTFAAIGCRRFLTRPWRGCASRRSRATRDSGPHSRLAARCPSPPGCG
jgi:hypothetical protein